MFVKKLLDFYTKSLGLNDRYPKSFKPEYASVYAAYCAEAETKDAELRPLLLALAFIAYMKSIGISVLVKNQSLLRMREVLLSAFSPKSVCEQLLVSDLKDQAALMCDVLRSAHMPQQLIVRSNKTLVGKSLVQHIVLGTKNQPLDAVLSTLQGFLYTSSTVPVQLQEIRTKVPPNSKLKSRTITPSVRQCVSSNSTLGWLCLRRTSRFSIYLVRASKDHLVMRITLSIQPSIIEDLLDQKTVKALTQKYWQKVFKYY